MKFFPFIGILIYVTLINSCTRITWVFLQNDTDDFLQFKILNPGSMLKDTIPFCQLAKHQDLKPGNCRFNGKLLAQFSDDRRTAFFQMPPHSGLRFSRNMPMKNGKIVLSIYQDSNWVSYENKADSLVCSDPEKSKLRMEIHPSYALLKAN